MPGAGPTQNLIEGWRSDFPKPAASHHYLTGLPQNFARDDDPLNFGCAFANRTEL